MNSGNPSGYYFESPSGRWHCGIVPHSQAGCQSTSGATIGIEGEPDAVADTDGTDSAPNAIVVSKTGEAHFAALADGQFSPDSDSPEVLSFNLVLAAAGFRCNVQESAGVSCVSESTAKGFTFSRDGYELRYTDVPDNAPLPDS